MYYGLAEEAGTSYWSEKTKPKAEDYHTFTVAIGARGSGKSYIMLGTAVAFLLANNGCEALMVRKHWNELANSIVRDLKRVQKLPGDFDNNQR